jgi:hypothetical protein
MELMKYIQAVFRRYAKETGHYYPPSAQERREQRRRGAEQETQAEAEARQRLNSYSPTSAIGVLIGDDGEEGHS